MVYIDGFFVLYISFIIMETSTFLYFPIICFFVKSLFKQINVLQQYTGRHLMPRHLFALRKSYML